MSDSPRSASLDVLVVDDDHQRRAAIFRRITERGFRAQQAGAADALDSLRRHAFDLAVLDLAKSSSRLELLQSLQTQHADCEVILLTSADDAESGTGATNLRDVDFLQKPFPLQALDALLHRAAERRRLSKENWQLRTLLGRAESKAVILGQSTRMQEVPRWIERVAAGDDPVLIQGEPGTGKALVARAVHQNSGRAAKSLVVVSCVAYSDTALERELFGHENGDDGSPPQPGLLEVADGGTLLLNEIGQLPLPLQAKLLEVINLGTVQRIGSPRQRHVDVRLLMSTICDLSQEVAAGRFHPQLYARLQPTSITLPPLRERSGDLPLLIKQALGESWSLAPEAEQALLGYSWPGNVGQLFNVLEQAKLNADDSHITLGDLPRTLRQGGATSPAADDTDDLCTIERRKVVAVLKRERGNKARTARALGIDRRKLYRLIEKYSIRGDELGPGK